MQASEPGVYTVVAELPELGMSATQRLDFHPGEANPCASVQSASLAATLEWSSDDTLRVSPAVSALSLTTCEWLNRVRSKLNSLMNSKPPSTCSRPFAMRTTVGKSCFPVIQNLQFDALDVRLVQDGTPILADGFYTMRLTVLSTSAASTSMPFAWPADYTDEEEADSSPSEPRHLRAGRYVGGSPHRPRHLPHDGS